MYTNYDIEDFSQDIETLKSLDLLRLSLAIHRQSPIYLRSPQTPPTPNTVQHMLFGSPTAVRNTIKTLHKLHYADATDWSKLMPTGRVNELMAILIEKVRVD